MRKTTTIADYALRRWATTSMLLMAALGGDQHAAAQVSTENLRLPISLDAETTDYDGKISMLKFTGLRLTQGNIGIVADEGRASKLDFEDSVWQFSGNVRIDTDTGRVECETANLQFTDHQLQHATISGAPATFELRRPESTDVTYAEAGRLNYNFALGVVEFSENATITEGGNKISSGYLVYNIAEQRINAQSPGPEGERVKIIYTPSQVPDDAGEATIDALTEATIDAATDAGADAADDKPDPPDDGDSTQ